MICKTHNFTWALAIQILLELFKLRIASTKNFLSCLADFGHQESGVFEGILIKNKKENL